jgi:hypothetical protein
MALYRFPMHKLTKVTLPHCFVLSLFSVFMLYSTSVFSAPVGHAPWVGDTLKGAPCKGGMENFGPFDYLLRNQLPGQLSIVEKHHFNPQVEQLIKGAEQYLTFGGHRLHPDGLAKPSPGAVQHYSSSHQYMARWPSITLHPGRVLSTAGH